MEDFRERKRVIEAAIHDKRREKVSEKKGNGGKRRWVVQLDCLA